MDVKSSHGSSHGTSYGSSHAQHPVLRKAHWYVFIASLVAPLVGRMDVMALLIMYYHVFNEKEIHAMLVHNTKIIIASLMAPLMAPLIAPLIGPHMAPVVAPLMAPLIMAPVMAPLIAPL